MKRVLRDGRKDEGLITGAIASAEQGTVLGAFN